jgi:predicted TIM-barrel fold metal-dependent hydrolase
MIDTCAFVGRWPFRKLQSSSVSDLAESCKANGIIRAVVGSLDAVFYNDPMEADETLAQELPPQFALAISHNPTLPFAKRDVIANALKAKVVRIYPGYHGYSLEEPCVREFCETAAQSGLAVQIMHKMDDIRLDYIARQSPPPLENILALADSVPSGKFLLSGYNVSASVQNARIIQQIPNLFVDTAYSGNIVFPYEELAEVYPVERILFATHQPLFCPDVNCLAVSYAQMPQDTVERILRRNAEVLFGWSQG